MTKPTVDSDSLGIRLQSSSFVEPVDVAIGGHLLNGLVAAAVAHCCPSDSTFWYRDLRIEPVYDAKFLGLYPGAMIHVRREPDIMVDITWDDPRIPNTIFYSYSTDTATQIRSQCSRAIQSKNGEWALQPAIQGLLFDGQLLGDDKTPKDLGIDGRTASVLRLHGFREEGGRMMTLCYNNETYLIGKAVLERFAYFSSSIRFPKPDNNEDKLELGPFSALGSSATDNSPESRYGDVSDSAFSLFVGLLRWHYVHPPEIAPTDAYAIGMPIGTLDSPQRDRLPGYPDAIDLHTWLEIYRISTWFWVDSIAKFAYEKLSMGITELQGRPIWNGELLVLLEDLYETSELDIDDPHKQAADIYMNNDKKLSRLRAAVEMTCLHHRIELKDNYEFLRIYNTYERLRRNLDVHSANRHGRSNFLQR